MVKVSPVTGKEGYPGPGWHITSGYATQAYFDRFGDWHTGHDLAKSPQGGEPIYAVTDGVVKYAEFAGNNGFGNLVFIQHNDTLFTRYAHLREIHVQRNQQVTAGQIIGLLGTTGRSTGNHLHFDLMVTGNALDWPGKERMRALQQYIDPRTWFNNHPTIIANGSQMMRVIANDGLNVRARPSTNGEKQYALEHNAIITVKSIVLQANNLSWRELLAGGWVADKFLEPLASNGTHRG
jgi:murein DD-endopeptidase MepM/ murein hydrolase activator NlpD